MSFEFILFASIIIGVIKGLTDDDDFAEIIEKIIYRRK
jgi:hypothetical protein